MLIDESGFFLNPLVRRTWAPKGKTPVLPSWGRHRDKVSVIAALSVAPRRILRVKPFPERLVAFLNNPPFAFGQFKGLAEQIQQRADLKLLLRRGGTAARDCSGANGGGNEFIDHKQLSTETESSACPSIDTASVIPSMTGLFAQTPPSMNR